MEEEIRNWIRKKTKEIEESGGGFEQPEVVKEQAISKDSSEKSEARPTEDQTSKPVELEQQPVEQKTAAEITQSASIPKSSEATIPENEPEEIPEEDQYPPSQPNLSTMKTEYPSKPSLLTKKAKILIVLIAISVAFFIFMFLYVIPKILV